MMAILMGIASGFEWFASTKIGRIVGLIGLALGLLLVVYLKGKSAGRNQERLANKKETDRLVHVKEKIDEDIANDSDAALDRRVRPWIRKRS